MLGKINSIPAIFCRLLMVDCLITAPDIAKRISLDRRNDKFIVSNVFLWKILIITRKILITAVVSNETTNALTIYSMLCQNITILYQQELASLFQIKKKLRARRNLKYCFLSICFISGDCQMKIIYLYILVFKTHDILHF